MMHEGHEGVTELTKIDYLSAFLTSILFQLEQKCFFSTRPCMLLTL